MTKGREATTSSTRTFRTSNETTEKKTSKKPRRKFKLDYQKVLIVLLVLFSIFMISQYRSAKDKVQTNSSTNNSRQAASVVSRVNKLIILPKNENPKIFVVKDLTKLKDNPFYANAKNGDVTLVYTNQKRAILYRPSENIIVNVANVTLSSDSGNP